MFTGNNVNGSEATAVAFIVVLALGSAGAAWFLFHLLIADGFVGNVTAALLGMVTLWVALFVGTAIARQLFPDEPPLP
jgi:hypothetical protein